jgi:hypothetical protein
LNVLDTFDSKITIVEGEFLYFGMDSESQGEFFHALISDGIVVNSELDNIAFIVHEHLGQKLASKGSDLVVHEIEKFDRVDFFDVVANRPEAFVLEIDFPEPDFFKVGIVEISEGLHKGSNLERAELLPELKLSKEMSTV